MARDDHMVAAYVATLTQKLTAVYVITAKGRTRIACGDDPAGRLKKLCKADPDAGLVVIGWCREERAEMLLMFLRGDFDEGTRRGSLSASSVIEATQRVLAAVAQRGLVLQTEAELRAIAEEAVQHVGRVFHEQLDAGELRGLNRRYRAARLAHTAAGKTFTNYKTWLADQQLAMVRATAEIAGS